MKKTARILILCLIVTAQVSMFAFAWHDHQQTGEMLWNLRMGHKALVFTAEGRIIDFGPDPPLFVPVVLVFLLCLLLTIVLLADDSLRGTDETLPTRC